MALRGKWAQGIEPRDFTWVLQDRLAVCERPGGYGTNHRKVRRQEEIIWLREQGFSLIVSVSASPHNLHAYEEMEMPYRHRPFASGDELQRYLGTLFAEIRHLLIQGRKILVHQDELGEQIGGFVGAYVLWNGLVPAGPQAISVVEQLLHRQLSPVGRELVSLVPRLPPPSANVTIPESDDRQTLSEGGLPVEGAANDDGGTVSSVDDA